MVARKTRFGTRTNFSASGADLGSIVRLNSNNNNPFSFSFILDKALQLVEAPIANPIIHSFSSPDFSDSFEVFHYNLVSIEIGNNFLTKVMINPSHPAVFPTAKLFEQSLSRPCAFALKLGTQELEFSFNLLDLRRIKELSIGSNCEIVYSDINPENPMQVRAFRTDVFGEREQEEASAFSIYSQKAFSNIPVEVFPIAIRNTKGDFNPAFDCSKTEDVVFKGSTAREIVSNGASIDYGLGFSSFDYSTSLFYTSNSELALQSFSFDILIDKGMKLDVISDFSLPSLIDAELQSLMINFDSPNYFRSCFNLNLSCCPNLHTFINIGEYIKLSEGVSHPNAEAMGIRNEKTI